MAYAQSFIDQCRNNGISDDEILDQISKTKRLVSQIEDIYNHLSLKYKEEKRKKNSPFAKRPFNARDKFRKYVYQYIKMSKKIKRINIY
jgi:hypothetical protein